MKLPDGWKIKTLGEVCDGQLQTGPFGSQLHAHEYQETGISVLMPKDIINCRADISTAARISIERANDLNKHKLFAGDLLFSRRGDVARFALIDEKTEGNLCGTGCLKARPSKNHSSIFLSYILQKNSVKMWLEQNAVGQTMPNMNTSILTELPLISASSRQEEDKIAQILSTWDKAIENVEKLIINSQQRKKSLMQKLLTGKVRFAGFEKKLEQKTIKQMGVVVAGGTPETHISEYWNGDILWMTPTDVTALKTRFINNTARMITENGVKNSSATIIPKGSLLVCTRATIGVMSISTTDITTNQGFKNLIPNSNFDVNFLYYLFNFFKNQFIRYACGSTFFELSKKDFEKLLFKCPELNEQQKIAAVLSNSDNEIEALQKKLACLKQEKKSLMQQLLTGKRRVNVND